MTPAETIKGLEAVREWIVNRGWPSNEYAATIESALAALREQDQRASAVGASSHDAAIGSPATSDQSEAHQSEREKAAREAASFVREKSRHSFYGADKWEEIILRHFNLEAK